MKSKIVALGLFVFTAASVALYPAYRDVGAITTHTPTPDPAQLANQRPRIEVVFVLDTTGSMSGLIAAAKEKIWSIASTMASAQPAPEIRMGLVAYRDRGDAYVTRTVDLSADLDSVYARLMDFQADGGGDTPESVNQAIYEAVHNVSWSQDPGTYKVVFLVGDAPPHMGYRDDVKYPQTAAAAIEKGIVINAIQCGQSGATARHWEQLAHLGHGEYFNVDQSGSAVVIATPFDDELAKLATRLDETRVYYGTAEEQARQRAKVAATEKLTAAASVASRARRAAFNVSASGRENFLGEGELVDDVASGKVDLSGIDADTLPASLQTMRPAEQQAVIEARAKERTELQEEIRALADKREGYLESKVEEVGGAAGSLDAQIYNAIRAQGASRGLQFEADAPAY